ncbi:MAG TPA: thrombospondin type 3 repeat-containing protein, partial [Myxococcota bacterium]|nr:thrombospondin type 3 repeat-containing protein [Myxococcota bacterium]
ALFFCGVPDNEPSCLPSRPGEYNGVTSDDDDGDGVADGVDNCPLVFNPIRPMDGGRQPDVDDDGVGDVCDPCPFDADTTECTGFNADDVDGDGIPNDIDNC